MDDQVRVDAERAIEKEKEARKRLRREADVREREVFKYNTALLADMGINDDTIVEVPLYSWGRTAAVVVARGSERTMGYATGRPVTVRNKLHKGRVPVSFQISEAKITDRVLASKD